MADDIAGMLVCEYSIVSFLPYSSDHLLRNRKEKQDIIKLMLKLVSLSIESLLAFARGKYRKFDAQVGENLCQIRAWQIMVFAVNEQSELSVLIEKLSIFQDKLKKLDDYFFKKMETHSKYDAVLDKKESISTFFTRHDIFYSLDRNIMFLFCCYFLNKYCVMSQDAPVAIDYKKIANNLNITKHSSKRIATYYQIQVSKLGCRCLISSLRLIDCLGYGKDVFIRMLEVSDDNRVVLPCYEVMKIILHYMLIRRMHLVLEVSANNDYFFLLQGCRETNKFYFVDNKDELEESMPIVVFRGSTDYNLADATGYNTFISVVQDESIYSILLNNVAMHPQYSGDRLRSKRDDPFERLLRFNDGMCSLSQKDIKLLHEIQERFNLDKKHALLKGCCRENSKLFYLKHVYCENLEVYKGKLSGRNASMLDDHKSYSYK